ncbi:MAG: hypothetical protein ACREYE_17165, partial [Gammaproteobacteria bacterium]
ALRISQFGGARNPHVFQYTFQFLRSGEMRPPFARNDFFTSSQLLRAERAAVEILWAQVALPPASFCSGTRCSLETGLTNTADTCHRRSASRRGSCW